MCRTWMGVHPMAVETYGAWDQGHMSTALPIWRLGLLSPFLSQNPFFYMTYMAD